MKKKNKKVAYSKVSAKMFVSTRVKAGWPVAGEAEAEWMTAVNGKSHDFNILWQPGQDNQKIEGKS